MGNIAENEGGPAASELAKLCRRRERELRSVNGELAREIVERRKVEKKLEQVVEELEATLNAIPELVAIVDKESRIVKANRAFAGFAGLDPAELYGRVCCSILHGGKRPRPNCSHRKTLATKRTVTDEVNSSREGVYFELLTSPVFDGKGGVLASVHVARDVTARKKMDEQLVITDRLASVGELASGIAHELNNPLTSVIGFSQLLLDKDIPDDIKGDVMIISSEAQRAARVIKNLLTFARKHAPVKQPVNINEVIEKVLELRAYEHRVNNIRVETRLAPDLLNVMADYFQLQQVFLNIVLNAEHFMTECRTSAIMGHK